MTPPDVRPFDRVQFTQKQAEHFQRETLRLLAAQRDWWRERDHLLAQIATLAAIVENKTCSQCGQSYRMSACGPTHASVDAALRGAL